MTNAKTYQQTGVMDAGDGHIVFGAEGARVIIMCDSGDIVLSPDDQDTFTRNYFRAVIEAETITEVEAPF